MRRFAVLLALTLMGCSSKGVEAPPHRSSQQRAEQRVRQFYGWRPSQTATIGLDSRGEYYAFVALHGTGGEGTVTCGTADGDRVHVWDSMRTRELANAVGEFVKNAGGDVSAATSDATLASGAVVRLEYRVKDATAYRLDAACEGGWLITVAGPQGSNVLVLPFRR